MKKYKIIPFVVSILLEIILCMTLPQYTIYIMIIFGLFICFFVYQLFNEKENVNTYQKEMVAKVFNAMSYPVIFINEKGFVSVVNQKYKEIFGIKQVNTYYRLLTREIVEMIDKDMTKNGDISTFEYHQRFYHIESSRISNRKKEPLGCIYQFIDVTDFLDLQNYQKQQLDDISHELKTPLTALVGVADIIKTYFNDKDTEIKSLGNILVKESQRMKYMVDELLDISKLNQQQFVFHPENINIEELITSTIQLFENKAKQKNIQINYQNKVQSLLFLDVHYIKQIIINLLSNAIAYTDQGSIDIESQYQDHQFIFIITDTGIGIDEKHLPNIFKRFYCVDKARTRIVGGTGLGLSIVENIVKEYQGTIEVKSKVNKGTTFIVKIPC